MLPASKRDALGAGHLAVFLRDLLAHVDLGPILEAYADDRGQPPYDPRMMTGLLLYADSCGIGSWGGSWGRCLRMADYVRGPAATRGANRR